MSMTARIGRGGGDGVGGDGTGGTRDGRPRQGQGRRMDQRATVLRLPVAEPAGERAAPTAELLELLARAAAA